MKLLTVQWRRYLQARYAQARGHLVVFDRYAYDALLPQPQRRNPLKRLRRWLLAHACPPPHLVLVLDAPAEVLYARKGEHTVGKLESQRQAYRSLQTRLSNVTILDATREAEHVRRQANRRPFSDEETARARPHDGDIHPYRRARNYCPKTNAQSGLYNVALP